MILRVLRDYAVSTPHPSECTQTIAIMSTIAKQVKIK